MDAYVHARGVDAFEVSGGYEHVGHAELSLDGDELSGVAIGVTLEGIQQ